MFNFKKVCKWVWEDIKRLSIKLLLLVFLFCLLLVLVYFLSKMELDTLEKIKNILWWIVLIIFITMFFLMLVVWTYDYLKSKWIK